MEEIEEDGQQNSEDEVDSDYMDLDGELSSSTGSHETESESIESETDLMLKEDAELNGQSKNVEKKQEKGDANEEDQCDIDDKSEFKVLGEHRFVEKRILSSAPVWAEHPTTFDAQIHSRVGKGIKYINGLDQHLFETLSKEISVWFPVQTAVLPKLVGDDSLHDVAISAPTGSGKTFCYLIPILNQFMCGWKSKYIMALVLAPTRTLIRQISREFNRFNSMGVRIATLNDGLSYESERQLLFPGGSTKARVHVIISTPQRLVEHLIDRSGTINLKRLRYLVVDEADSMRFVREEWLGMVERASNYPPMNNLTANTEGQQNPEGYNTDLRKILVSATLSLDADKLHDWNLRSPCLYRATPKKVTEKHVKNEEAGTSETGNHVYNLPASDVGRLILPAGLTQEVKICEKRFKPLLVYAYLGKHPNWRKILVFVNSVDTSRRLTILLTYLFEGERRISEISSNLHARRRLKVLNQISKAENCVVICSDTVGRGIDVPDLDTIINYDVPRTAKIFVHRAGRVARAGRSGHVVTLATKEEKLGLKRELISVDLWDPNVENREKDVRLLNRYEEKYQNALTSLKQQLEETPLREKFKKKKYRFKRFK